MSRQQQRVAAIAMAVLGAVLAVIGLIGILNDDGDTSADTAATTTTTTTTTAAPTTTVAATTTTTTTTTTTIRAETVDEFVVLFQTALESGDSGFVFDRLHPTVIMRSDEDTCRAFVETNVMPITNYRLTGNVTGPEEAEFTINDRVITVSEMYRAPVAFDFPGEQVETEGQFATVEGEIRWFTNCE